MNNRHDWTRKNRERISKQTQREGGGVAYMFACLRRGRSCKQQRNTFPWGHPKCTNSLSNGVVQFLKLHQFAQEQCLRGALHLGNSKTAFRCNCDWLPLNVIDAIRMQLTVVDFFCSK